MSETHQVPRQDVPRQAASGQEAPGGAPRVGLPTFRTPVRGHAFAPRRPESPDPSPGETAELVREPANPADPHAVAVWVGEGPERWRIGYLDRGVAARVAPRLRNGVVLSARIDGWTPEPQGRWRRPVVLLRAEPSDPAGARPGSPRAGPGAPPPGVWGRPPGVRRRPVPTGARPGR